MRLGLVAKNRPALVVAPDAADFQTTRRVTLEPQADAPQHSQRADFAGLDVRLDPMQTEVREGTSERQPDRLGHQSAAIRANRAVEAQVGVLEALRAAASIASERKARCAPCVDARVDREDVRDLHHGAGKRESAAGHGGRSVLVERVWELYRHPDPPCGVSPRRLLEGAPSSKPGACAPANWYAGRRSPRSDSRAGRGCRCNARVRGTGHLFPC